MSSLKVAANLSISLRSTKGLQTLSWTPGRWFVPNWTYQEVNAVPLPVWDAGLILAHASIQTCTHRHTLVYSAMKTSWTPCGRVDVCFVFYFSRSGGVLTCVKELCVCQCVCVCVLTFASSHWVMTASKTGKATTIHFTVGVWSWRKNVSNNNTDQLQFILFYFPPKNIHNCDFP